MKSIPKIQKYMTTLPHTIGADQTLAKAEEMMREHEVRHLPVLDGGNLIGILSDRDIKLIETFKDVDASKVTVEEAFSPNPFTVSTDAALNEVCEQMVEHKFGCALVVDNHKLVGIFTWIDALKALNELAETRLKH